MLQARPPAVKVLELTYQPAPQPSSSEKSVSSKLWVAWALVVTNLDHVSDRRLSMAGARRRSIVESLPIPTIARYLSCRQSMRPARALLPFLFFYPARSAPSFSLVHDVLCCGMRQSSEYVRDAE